MVKNSGYTYRRTDFSSQHPYPEFTAACNSRCMQIWCPFWPLPGNYTHMHICIYIHIHKMFYKYKMSLWGFLVYIQWPELTFHKYMRKLGMYSLKCQSWCLLVPLGGFHSPFWLGSTSKDMVPGIYWLHQLISPQVWTPACYWDHPPCVSRSLSLSVHILPGKTTNAHFPGKCKSFTITSI